MDGIVSARGLRSKLIHFSETSNSYLYDPDWQNSVKKIAAEGLGLTFLEELISNPNKPADVVRMAEELLGVDRINHPDQAHNFYSPTTGIRGDILEACSVYIHIPELMEVQLYNAVKMALEQKSLNSMYATINLLNNGEIRAFFYDKFEHNEDFELYGQMAQTIGLVAYYTMDKQAVRKTFEYFKVQFEKNNNYIPPTTMSLICEGLEGSIASLFEANIDLYLQAIEVAAYYEGTALKEYFDALGAASAIPELENPTNLDLIKIVISLGIKYKTNPFEAIRIFSNFVENIDEQKGQYTQ